ncbi:hypothetical protein LIER_40539 [Lithospermum erythrorhizon]|uniref:Reverse transcriptase RNase H-like domain-containing protein n=1 Tax=Lithospermum erythrorhizon TaxID=34254 RepID=A0AAV3QYN7_LITER
MCRGFYRTKGILRISQVADKTGGRRRIAAISRSLRGGSQQCSCQKRKGITKTHILCEPCPSRTQIVLPLIDNFVFAVVIAARKLKASFETHPIKVMIDQPIRRVMSNPSMMGRLTTWAIELGKFEISYAPRTGMKGQTVTTRPKLAALRLGSSST